MCFALVYILVVCDCVDVSIVLKAPVALLAGQAVIGSYILRLVDCHWHQLEWWGPHLLYAYLVWSSNLPALCIVFSCCARVLLCWCVHSQFECAARSCRYYRSSTLCSKCWLGLPAGFTFAELVNALDILTLCEPVQRLLSSPGLASFGLVSFDWMIGGAVRLCWMDSLTVRWGDEAEKERSPSVTLPSLMYYAPQ